MQDGNRILRGKVREELLKPLDNCSEMRQKNPKPTLSRKQPCWSYSPCLQNGWRTLSLTCQATHWQYLVTNLLKEHSRSLPCKYLKLNCTSLWTDSHYPQCNGNNRTPCAFLGGRKSLRSYEAWNKFLKYNAWRWSFCLGTLPQAFNHSVTKFPSICFPFICI